MKRNLIFSGCALMLAGATALVAQQQPANPTPGCSATPAQLAANKKLVMSFFDPAVTRAHRFDALVHVSPPSFNRKVNQLRTLLSDTFSSIRSIGFTRQQVEEALNGAANAEPVPENDEQSDLTVLPYQYMLAKFLLMRYDQLENFASLS